MAVHHRHPRKLYNTLAGDLSQSGAGGADPFDARYDLARMMRAEKESDPAYYKVLSEVSGINRKRISQIARMVGDDPEGWESRAIRDGMRLLRGGKAKKRKGR